MKNQLFRISPDMEITENILHLFGIKDIHDNHSFTRMNLIDLKTVEKMNELSENLVKYYIPCKSKTYLQDITLKRSIVILRHFLKCHNYNIHSKEKFVNGIKHTTYRIFPQTDGIVVPDKPKPVIVCFD